MRKEIRMKASERREKIRKYLEKENEAVSASVLASEFGVSRQIIVGDIAILRAAGYDIAATPRGYLMTEQRTEEGIRRQIVCLHTEEQTEEELNICVDYGCAVEDVIVEHPVYGQLTGMLDIATRYDVRNFMKKSRDASAHALYELTDGIHIHTLEYADDETFARTISELDAAGLLYKES